MAHAGTEETTGPPDGGEPETAAVDREFVAALARRGIEMPPDLAPGVLAGNRSLRAMNRLLREAETTDV
ncbi:hypothetical protein ACPEIF_12040 [Streptomyces sp. NPDC012600]|uniref:Uncharacterized protein n=2 Tax=Streptomycetaceae TaxID=2062 RepID=A0ABU2W2U6_9ACTN|nr:hypothetical protein [Streptomyces griseus]ARF73144.1 hypothetical protein B7C62_13355 [Kitasatospora albolonga]MDT0492187.1 hypothetical protein [Streptomyces griseus]